jgi:HlyD family secretion protein
LFELRRSAREGQKAQLKQRISQLNEEIQGYSGQIDAKGRELDLIGQELEGVRDLRLKNLVSLSRMTSLEREAARLEGERSQLIGNRAQAKGKITETELQILQIDQDMRSDVGKDLADARAKISELVERKIAAEDQLKRIDIRAPQDGIVHELSVHTVGGVITPGETVMLIVPDADALTVEAKVAPQEIDQLFIGQKAALRFSAFNQRSTPEIEGRVSLVSADLTQDHRTGVSYYTIRIALSPEQIALLGSVKLVPGMPVETFVHTGERTALSYLMKPLRDQAARSGKNKYPALARAIEARLAAAADAGIVRYGIHQQDRAMMTCFTPSAFRSDHVHFIDGALGGYALAASALKGEHPGVMTKSG